MLIGIKVPRGEVIMAGIPRWLMFFSKQTNTSLEKHLNSHVFRSMLDIYALLEKKTKSPIWLNISLIIYLFF